MNIFYPTIIITCIILILVFNLPNNKIKLSIYTGLTIFLSLYVIKHYNISIKARETIQGGYAEVFNELQDSKIYNKFLTTPININGRHDITTQDLITDINIEE